VSNDQLPSAGQITGFRNRDALIGDLERALIPGSSPSVLVVFALTGFADYRELVGKIESEKLFAGLAEALQAALGSGASCYLPRADEFVAVLRLPLESARPLLDAAEAALADAGRLAPITVAYGVTILPDEAEEPVEALILADQQLNIEARSRERRRGAIVGRWVT
jgi:GGDEF domain-containing protein